jgi:hypothetical protein
MFMLMGWGYVYELWPQMGLLFNLQVIYEHVENHGEMMSTEENCEISDSYGIKYEDESLLGYSII